jgi:hypothetical protein
VASISGLKQCKTKDRTTICSKAKNHIPEDLSRGFRFFLGDVTQLGVAGFRRFGTTTRFIFKDQEVPLMTRKKDVLLRQ